MDAGDVSQETYLRLLRLKDVEVIEQPHAYVFRVAIHVVREMSIREQSQAILPQTLGQAFESEGPFNLPMDTAEHVARLAHLQQCINGMPSTYQAILVLRKRDGMTYQEIAKKLGISVHTVKKYLYRAVSQCRQHEQRNGDSV